LSAVRVHEPHHVSEALSQPRRVVRQQPLADVRVRLVHQGELGVGRERDALQDTDSADDESEVGRDAERVVERDLRQVRGQRLEAGAQTRKFSAERKHILWDTSGA
jgi:hypothetical protein